MSPLSAAATAHLPVAALPGLGRALSGNDPHGPFPAPTSGELKYAPARLFGHTLRWKIGSLDLSINRVVLLEFLVTGLLCLLMAAAFRRPKIVPRTTQNIVEGIVGFVNKDIVDDIMGVKGRKYAPYLISLFFFTWFCNLTEIVPGIEFPVDARTGLPLILALITLILFIREGIKAAGVGGYLKESLFPPGVPIAIYFILTPIELISTFIIRPFTLFVRLSANMIAGHFLLGIMYVATDYLLFGFHYGKSFTAIFAVGSFTGAVVFTAFELFVASLQAYIFTLLSAVYISGAMEPAH